MRIVTEAQLKELPYGTVYSEYEVVGLVGGLWVKGRTKRLASGEAVDWYCTPLLGQIASANRVELLESWDLMQEGDIAFPASFKEIGPDAAADPTRRFLVYSPSDVYGLALVLLDTMRPADGDF